MTNRLAQLTASSMRALAPTMVSSLFALSLELHVLDGCVDWFGGYFMYNMFSVIPGVAVFSIDYSRQWRCV